MTDKDRYMIVSKIYQDVSYFATKYDVSTSDISSILDEVNEKFAGDSEDMDESQNIPKSRLTEGNFVHQMPQPKDDSIINLDNNYIDVENEDLDSADAEIKGVLQEMCPEVDADTVTDEIISSLKDYEQSSGYNASLEDYDADRASLISDVLQKYTDKEPIEVSDIVDNILNAINEDYYTDEQFADYGDPLERSLKDDVDDDSFESDAVTNTDDSYND